VNLLFLRVSQIGGPQQQRERDSEHVHAAMHPVKTAMTHRATHLAWTGRSDVRDGGHQNDC